MIATIPSHPLSEVRQAIDAASARYFELAREGVSLWRTGAAQEARNANQAEKDAVYAQWRQPIGEIGGAA
ncbi:hypothetical protein GCM10022631_04770 [Deinococcus rubellus]|uniref:Uncharacterized protein n=1 Tax=Deinococcus rubellus TaxID=1889240 RepID=A0ABY5YGE2_9DEIO|nr:hypothetical protein [Deinococcus rubellus]UWX64169.1 hypothetical protein N0D28_00360 [Deinococcus rubellus]